MKIRTSLFLLPLLAIALPLQAATLEYHDGHGDIGIGGDTTALELHFHFEDGINESTPSVDAEYAPNEVYIRVPDASKFTTTGDIPSLGTTTGDDIWVLPSANTVGMPFLGVASEELSNPPFTAMSLQLTGFIGPAGGEFLLSQTVLTTTTEHMKSIDGVANPDTWDLVVGGHDHADYAFSKEGVYQLEFTATGTYAGGQATDTATFTFVVGSSTPIPEPSTGALALIGGLLAAAGRRRRG